MKRLFKKLGGGKNEGDAAGPLPPPDADGADGQPLQQLIRGAEAQPPLRQQGNYVATPSPQQPQRAPSRAGSRRAARRPKETLEFEIFLPPEPAPPPPPPPRPRTPPPSPLPEPAVAAALVEPELVAAQQEELERMQGEAEQAAVDKAVEESFVTVDYDNLLRDIRLWILDLVGAAEDVAGARAAAAAARAEHEAEAAAAAADPAADPERLHLLAWLSEQLPGAEARLEGVAAHVAPVLEAVEGLRDLVGFIERERPTREEAEGVRDAILAELFEDLGRQGLDPHHPLGAYGREAGPSAGSGNHAGEMRGRVQQLIEEARRIPPPPPMPAPPPPPEPEPEPEPVAAAALAAAIAADVPESEPEPEPEPEPTPPPALAPPAVAPPPATPPQPPARLQREPPKFNVPKLSARPARRKREAARPAKDDVIKRQPTAVTFYSELSEGGIVADVVGWTRFGAPGSRAGGNVYSRGDRITAKAAATPKGPPPAAGLASGGGADSGGACTPGTAGRTDRLAAASPREAVEEEEAEAAAAADGELAATLPARAAQVRAFQPAILSDCAEFVAELKSRGGAAPATAHTAAGWPRERWATLADAAGVHDRLVEMIATLQSWQADAAAGPVAEAYRLADYIDEVSSETSRVMYAHDFLRQRMVKHGVPWDPSLLVDVRWAAQHAAASLMSLALEATDEASKVKRAWQTQVVLQPLGCAAMGAFKVHQFCGGFNLQCTALWQVLYERADHWGRSIDPKWLRSTKIAKV
eukprot:scaffold6.g2670.t1